MDGYIAGLNGEADWIEMPDQNAAMEYFTAFVKEFDTVVIGGRTFALMATDNPKACYPGFGSFAAAGLVDTVEVAIVPVLLGAGKPLMEGCAHRVKLELISVDENVLGCV